MRRLPFGGRIRRDRPLRFTWNGQVLDGYEGDTLASALLGAGVDVVGRSLSFGRPRGISSAGLEEASGFAQILSGGASEPLVRMNAVALYEGLAAESRNGRGVVSSAEDEGRFDKRYAHCDVLVVGAGPAGIAAALVTSAAGARTILVEADDEIGGALLRDGELSEWRKRSVATLASTPETCVLTSATASVMLDQNGVLVAQRVGCRLSPGERAGLPEQRLWHVRAKAIILATGALERPIVFQDNDRPGILLASAARAYLNRFALAPARGLVFTTNDDGYRTALDWIAAGVDVAAVVDPRPAGKGQLPEKAAAAGVRVLREAVVGTTFGDSSGRLRAVRVGSEEIETDLLAVSGGFEPFVDLHLQRRAPLGSFPGQWIAGAANGGTTLAQCLSGGARAGREALVSAGFVANDVSLPAAEPVAEDAPSPLWHVRAPDGDESRSFVDLFRDGTVLGIERAVSTGIRHIEHVKRYTVIGTGVDQGRSARANASALTARLTARPLGEVGTSGSRPPIEPLSFRLLAGRATGKRFDPVRTTAIHGMHVALGAVFEVSGQWLRPNHYPRKGESMEDAVRRECRAARNAVAVIDVSTLGKIDVRGPDALWFLEKIYANAIGSLPVGKARYSVICRPDGSIFDDGIVMRTGADRFFVTASTGHAAAVVDWMEEWLQTEWHHRRVFVTSLTEQLSTLAVVGPRSRDVIRAIAPELDVSKEAFPFLSVRRGTVAGISDAQIARVSFSGELAFEVSVPWELGAALFRSILDAGESFGIEPYGLEALQVLRSEKGYIIVGQDTEGTTTPDDAGLSWLVSKKKDFIGKRSFSLPALRAPDRHQLVGFLPDEPTEVVPEGAGLVSQVSSAPVAIQGHVTTSHFSEALGRSFGLAMVRGGRARHGDKLRAPLEDRVVTVTLVDPVHYDRNGERRDG
ncbi:MAG TPA: glycine cleavage T C-terminal barrel domain-containing protein [Vicinamibacteria bacterium]|nr:glycine cleavage T C-terminal barrel domain-containing protein [Vicinamibacteria bacterium]